MLNCNTNTEKNILLKAKNLDIDLNNLPKHIAFIMDGNGRWAKKQGYPRTIGHKSGVNTVKTLVKAFIALNIPVMTIYAFSTENWQRPREEVDFLMQLFQEVIDKECNELKENGVKINFIGKLEALSNKLQEKMHLIQEQTKNNTKLTLNVAINYGARTEILDAVKKLGRDLLANKIDIDNLTEKDFERYLYTAGLPDPDLLIRTSGEMRISNYLLWQIAYTEIWITSVYWPDFSENDLLIALKDYQTRERRFGKTY